MGEVGVAGGRHSAQCRKRNAKRETVRERGREREPVRERERKPQAANNRRQQQSALGTLGVGTLYWIRRPYSRFSQLLRCARLSPSWSSLGPRQTRPDQTRPGQARPGKCKLLVMLIKVPMPPAPLPAPGLPAQLSWPTVLVVVVFFWACKMADA